MYRGVSQTLPPPPTQPRPPNPEPNIDPRHDKQQPQRIRLRLQRAAERRAVGQAGGAPGVLLHRTLDADETLEDEDAGRELEPGPAGVVKSLGEGDRQEAGDQRQPERGEKDPGGEGAQRGGDRGGARAGRRRDGQHDEHAGDRPHEPDRPDGVEKLEKASHDGSTDGAREPNHSGIGSIAVAGGGPAMTASTSGAADDGGESAEQRIDARIAALGDWRGETLARIRSVIRQADPAVVEEWKWRGVPVWSHAGILCTGETYRSVVKMTFARGAALADPSGLFNASLEGNTRRAIDLREGDALDEAALTALIRAAVALNTSARPRRARTSA